MKDESAAVAEAENELTDLDILTVGLVGKAANQRKYLLLKSLEEQEDGGETVKEQEKVEKEERGETEKPSALDEIKTMLTTFFQRTKEEAGDVAKVGDVAKAARAALEALDGVQDGEGVKAVVAALTKLAGGEPKEANVEKSASPDPRIEALEKAQDEARVALEKAAKRAEDAEKVAQHERDLREKSEYLEKAQGYAALPAKADELAEYLRWAHGADPEKAEYIEGLLKAADGAMIESGVFNEVGTSATADESPFMAKVNQRAVEIRKSDAGLSEAEAFTKAFKEAGASDPAAAKAYVNERQQTTGRR